LLFSHLPHERLQNARKEQGSTKRFKTSPNQRITFLIKTTVGTKSEPETSSNSPTIFLTDIGRPMETLKITDWFACGHMQRLNAHEPSPSNIPYRRSILCGKSPPKGWVTSQNHLGIAGKMVSRCGQKTRKSSATTLK
jgi:hypothetical protein